MNWQPIDTYKNDYKRVLLFYDSDIFGELIVVGCCSNNQEWTNDLSKIIGSDWCRENKPKYWCELERPSNE